MEMLTRLAAAGLVALSLSGCAGVKYAVDEYHGIPVQEVVMPDDTYRVFDRPEQNKLMITSSVGSAAAQGFGSGLFLGMVDNTPPKPLFDAAALKFLEQSGRPGCRIIDSYIVVKPQFEVKYDCTPPAPPIASAAPRKPRSQTR
jgi:hypothetical protein